MPDGHVRDHGLSPPGAVLPDKTLRRVSQFHRQPGSTAPPESAWPGISGETTARAPVDGKCNDSLGPVTTPISIPQRRQPEQLSAMGTTPDSAVLDRMQELESAMASVKSSLDVHASSYYSVASQIAELNVRLGRFGVQDRSPGIGIRTVDVSDGGDHSYRSRTPSKLAGDSSLYSLASTTAVDVSEAPVHAHFEDDDNSQEGGDEQYTRIQQMIDSLIKDADSALNSMPSTGHHRTLYSDDAKDALPAPKQIGPGFPRRFRPRSASRAPHSAPRPNLRSREYSLRTPPAFRPSSALGMSPKRPQSRRLRPEIATDPDEADAESDSELGSLSASSGQLPRRNVYGRAARPHSSRARRRTNSGHYSDCWRADPMDRYRSDTIDSLMSNSSETCVSPGNRVSREFPCVPDLLFADMGCEAESMRTPTRATHLEADDCVRACSFPDRATRHFPLLESDRPLYGEPSSSSRPWGSASRGTHRSASLLNDNGGYDLHYCEGYRPGARVQGRAPARGRSNTYTSEASPVATGYFDYAYYDDMEMTGSLPLQWDGNAAERVVTSSDTACEPAVTPRMDVPQTRCKETGARSDRALSLTLADRQQTEIVKGSDGNLDLLNIISLVYWTLLFTLGALMLDSFLCQMAGKRVMDRIARTDDANGAGALVGHGQSESCDDDEKEPEGLASRVGHLVRWCVDGSESTGESTGYARNVRPRPIRTRKVSATRGSFEHRSSYNC